MCRYPCKIGKYQVKVNITITVYSFGDQGSTCIYPVHWKCSLLIWLGVAACMHVDIGRRRYDMRKLLNTSAGLFLLFGWIFQPISNFTRTKIPILNLQMQIIYQQIQVTMYYNWTPLMKTEARWNPHNNWLEAVKSNPLEMALIAVVRQGIRFVQLAEELCYIWEAGRWYPSESKVCSLCYSLIGRFLLHYSVDAFMKAFECGLLVNRPERCEQNTFPNFSHFCVFFFSPLSGQEIKPDQRQYLLNFCAVLIGFGFCPALYPVARELVEWGWGGRYTLVEFILSMKTNGLEMNLTVDLRI